MLLDLGNSARWNSVKLKALGSATRKASFLLISHFICFDLKIAREVGCGQMHSVNVAGAGYETYVSAPCLLQHKVSQQIEISSDKDLN